MIESSQGVLRLCHLSFNYIEYCAVLELRGVREHPQHPLWIRHWPYGDTFARPHRSGLQELPFRPING